MVVAAWEKARVALCEAPKVRAAPAAAKTREIEADESGEALEREFNKIVPSKVPASAKRPSLVPKPRIKDRCADRS